MSSHRELVNEFVATQDPLIQNEKVQQLVDLLHQNELTLLNFIQSLQMYITSNNDQIRVTIFKLLSEVLNKLFPTKLYPKDIEVLINFLYSKLSDKPVMKYVLLSIYSLVSMKFFDKTSTNNLLTNLIEHYNPKEHPQSVRLTALKITNLVITTCSKDQYNNDTFILCFLHVSQNEKDPSNLLLIFQLLNAISKTLEINKYSQQLFDTMFRYYPISFKSANQAQEAQVDSLKDSLNSSLASNDIFGEELFPNLIDKFNSSTSNQVKMDILTTISTVSQLYSPQVIQEHFMPLWNTLKYTIINQEVANQISIPKILAYYENSTNESDQIFHSTLIALKHLSSKINYEGKLLVFDDLSNNLLVTERNRRFLQSYLTLAIVCLPSTYSEDETDQVLQKTLKALFSEEQPLDQIRNKRLILTVLSYFTLNSKFTSQLYQYRDQIMNIIQSSLSTSDLETTLKGLTIQLITTLILSPKFKTPSGFETGLLDEEKDILVGELTDLLISNSLKDVVDFNAVIEKELLMSLAKLAKVNENENLIANQVINKVMIYLRDENIDLLYKCKLLNHLMKISQTQSLIQNLSIRLINLLETNSLNAELVMQSLSSLFSYLPMSYNTQPIVQKFIPPLLEYIFTTNKEDAITYVCEIVRRLTVGLNVDDSINFISEIFNIFIGFLNLPEIKSSAKIFSSDKFNPQIEHLPILLNAIQGLSNNVELNGLIDCTLLVESLKNVKFEKNITKLQVNVGIATLFNKYMNYSNFDSVIDNESTSMEIKIWSLYGLILKNEAEAIKRFVKLLDNLPFEQSLKAIDIIFTPIKEVYDIEDIEGVDSVNINHNLDYDVELLIAFKKEMESMFMMRKQSKLNICNLTIRNMWKQRTLEVLLSDEELNSEKIDLIIPMVLTYLPEDIYSVHLQKLLPNLIKTIQTCEDNKIINSILIIIQNILKEENGKVYLKSYIDTVMKIAIENAQSKTKQLQIQSLKCILNITTFELPLTVPYKKRVTKLCADLLDDKSRSVRTLAVAVRQSWEDLGLDLSM
ncbi:hypothetical protein CANINC_004160 [Pichia inconspicua]|uniref:MMS19 nucleotide excision repair protein n=1 Tax=Pichia inconspicua TaxID=52247 RepID=A0A4T0WYE0_9ASCO|nr:hypothetical protein CANINC_004160 [[Candida] inconspicua]